MNTEVYQTNVRGTMSWRRPLPPFILCLWLLLLLSYYFLRETVVLGSLLIAALISVSCFVSWLLYRSRVKTVSRGSGCCDEGWEAGCRGRGWVTYASKPKHIVSKAWDGRKPWWIFQRCCVGMGCAWLWRCPCYGCRRNCGQLRVLTPEFWWEICYWWIYGRFVVYEELG